MSIGGIEVVLLVVGGVITLGLVVFFAIVFLKGDGEPPEA